MARHYGHSTSYTTKIFADFAILLWSSIQKPKNPNVSAWHIISPGQQEKID